MKLFYYMYVFLVQAIQRRLNGNVAFTRDWTDYKTGFGNTDDAYWIGKPCFEYTCYKCQGSTFSMEKHVKFQLIFYSIVRICR
jgi:hypothetical protein